MNRVVVVAAKRTAIGNFGGSLSTISAPKLGAKVITGVLEQTKIASEQVDEVVMGNVLTAGVGQNPARQATIFSGIPYTTPATTVNVVCGSGLKAVQIASNSILLNENEIVIAGGQETMSLSPYLLSDLRHGKRMGNTLAVDSMIFDGLTDVYNNYHMGITAENLAFKYNISRSDQDEFALNSQIKAIIAQDKNKFIQEIVPISIVNKKTGATLIFEQDEFVKRNSTIEIMSKAKSVFKENGTVTANNSSGINDGASAVMLMSEKKAEKLAITPLAYINSFAVTGCDPAVMGIGPVLAIKQVLKNSSWEIDDVDLWELNEAFAAQSLAVIKELNLNSNKLNVNGGAIALGHPIGSSGCRILVTLIYEMIRQNVKKGIASLCIGGGMGIAVSITR